MFSVDQCPLPTVVDGPPSPSWARVFGSVSQRTLVCRFLVVSNGLKQGFLANTLEETAVPSIFSMRRIELKIKTLGEEPEKASYEEEIFEENEGRPVVNENKKPPATERLQRVDCLL